LLPVWPCAVLAGMLVLQGAAERLLNTRFTTIGWATLALVVVIAIVVASLRSRERVDEYEQIAHVIPVTSVDDTRSIYSDDFALYFPQFQNAMPRTTGGWAVVGLPNYARQALHLDWNNSEVLDRTIDSSRIRTVIFRVPPLNPTARSLVAGDSAHYKLIAKTQTHEIYRVE
jgi:hypothetical protein